MKILSNLKGMPISENTMKGGNALFIWNWEFNNF